MQRNFKLIFNGLLLISIIFNILILILLTLDFALNFKPSILDIVRFDFIVSILIILRTFFRLKNVKSKRTFLSRNWIDVLAIIPLAYIAISIFPNTYLLVIVLLLVRIYALFKYMLEIRDVIRLTRKTKLDYATVILLTTLIFGSILFYLVESPVNPTASTLDSSAFFMIVSMTTVGYGNTVPVTRIGQLIAVTAIVVGIAYTGWVTAAMASSLIEDFRKKRKAETEKLNKSMENILEKLDKIEKELEEIKDSKEFK
ncbi:potassium channel family protein [Methanobacterium oryzae]|uniref:potassium channel family protein n=1 Tax=Methanobacterium oryzae TaxID=69540 RepID=UPI003D2473F0